MKMEIYDLKINGWKNPVGYRLEPPVCSWKVRGARGHEQEYAKLEVSVCEDFREVIFCREGKELDSLGVTIDLKLEPYTRYFYRITVRTETEEEATSRIQYFETGFIGESWEAEWIGLQSEDSSDEGFYPLFSKKFTVGGQVKSARMYVCGLGLFEAYIDGNKIGDDLMPPFINDYKEHVQYCTYDITTRLNDGREGAEHQIEVILGDGWYKGRYGLDGQKNKFGDKFGLILQLRLRFEDGTIRNIGTDKSWSYRKSFLDRTDLYDGEIQNYLRMSEKEWEWKAAAVISMPVRLTERYSLPLHAMEDIPVKEVKQTPRGETVLDFGQNFAGYVECKQIIPREVQLKLEFGEILQDGNFYHDNYRTAKSEFVYISDGAERTIRPYFTFFGFRYVKVSGPDRIDAEAFMGKAVYSEMDRTGFIEISEEKINRLYENTVWGLKSNFLDMPTDCPQRDERLGWTGDAQVFCKTAGYHMDTAAFYQKFLRDLHSDQKRNGGRVAAYLPNFQSEICAAVWGDAATLIPYMLYEYYGSREALKENYPLMKEWVDYIDGEDRKRGGRHLFDFGFQFGDWLALDGRTEQSMVGRTDTAYIASIYFFMSAHYVSEAAGELGLEKEAREYACLSEKIRSAVLEEFYTPSGRLAVNTQTAYILALKSGIYRERQKIVDGLLNCFKKDCYRMKGGFVGAPMMCTVLAENGLSQMAYDLLFFEKYPSWLYEVNLGATTIWERWNSVLPDGKISGTGMNSLNHYSYGAVSEFLYRHAAGIQAVKPGFRRARLEPKPDARIRWLHCSYESAAGRFVSDWEIEKDGHLKFHFEVPFGAAAEIKLPGRTGEAIEVTSGTYEYRYLPEQDYRQLYNENTRIEQMAEDERAVKILQEIYPELTCGMEITDLEFATTSLSEARFMGGLTGQPGEKFDDLIHRISQLKRE